MELSENLDFLRKCGAHEIQHSGRTLLDHLFGTYSILRDADVGVEVCQAALFHSVYGTTKFREQLLPFSERATVVAQIGPNAEELVMLFALLDRPDTFLKTMTNRLRPLRFKFGALAPVGHYSEEAGISAQQFNHLLLIEVANLLDQRVLWRYPMLVRYAKDNGILNANGYSKAYPRPTLITGPL
ncbi:DUF6817 domain-containing protein [Paraburkholderia caledonica]|uniref:DUF6817 domain-containing protein n=1 Tax=Paraburkholderia caledonica TaxID=134536 RepID=A0AB73IN94_9BURK|nr:hypothetical protein [Paraburkholderia caledonica]